MKKKLHIITYGCQMNEDDSQLVAGKFAAKGFSLTEDQEKADVVVINTCTVRQHAEDRAVSKLGRLRKWKEAGPGRKIIFMGCAAERLGKEVKRRFHFVDEVVGAKSLNRFDDILEDWAGTGKPAGGKDYLKLFNSPITDYQTVMRGCSLNCSYCIVPSVRGRAVSLSRAEILRSVKEKAENGIREIILLGQTVNAYKDGGTDFAGLLEKLSGIADIKRIKFMSPHPLYFREDFFRLYAENKKISRHIHLPAQSGSDAVLKKMKRGYTAEKYLEIIARLRAADPDTSVSTDFIVGFPGETEKDFQRTLDLAEKLGCSFAFCFKYSPRTDRREDISDVSEKETERRLAGLLEIIRKNSRDIFLSRIGRIEEVLVEKENSGRNSRTAAPSAESIAFGRSSTGFNCSIINSGKAFKKGGTVKIRIERAEKSVLYGKAEK